MNEIKNDYPDSVFRGLTTSSIDFKYKVVLSSAFSFDGNHRNDKNYDELSINWNDDEKSLEYLKEQKKENSDKLKYAFGIVRIPTKRLKELKNKYNSDFMYERKPVDGNEYHGNILLNYDCIPKPIRQLIMNELALSVDLIHIYNQEQLEWKIL